MTRVYVAGHNGMVGSALVAELRKGNSREIITASRDQLDLRDQAQVAAFFRKTRPDEVYLAAARVGGIHANATYPADFIYENLMIECNVIHQAFVAGVSRLLFLGSSCIYPKYAGQPISESELLGGKLEPTNEPYAIAKIAGIKLCEAYSRQHGVDYRSVMPTNLYGPRDNFHPENSHVIPGLMQKFHHAVTHKEPAVTVWGSGDPRREFLHVEDLASACLFVMNLPRDTLVDGLPGGESHINIGTGKDISIRELAYLMAEVTDFKGDIAFDTSKPDGTPRKLLNVSRLQGLGWQAGVGLREGLADTYQWYRQSPFVRSS